MCFDGTNLIGILPRRNAFWARHRIQAGISPKIISRVEPDLILPAGNRMVGLWDQIRRAETAGSRRNVSGGGRHVGNIKLVSELHADLAYARTPERSINARSGRRLYCQHCV